MKKFIIERKLPGAGKLTPDELKEISKTSVEAISGLGKPYSWVESYVTEDKIYCVHIAEDEHVIREHSSAGNFPVNGVEEIKAIIDPSSAG
jgi:hypothetical protein